MSARQWQGRKANRNASGSLEINKMLADKNTHLANRKITKAA
jgi:hypothetical protein